ncbi:MAG: ABC transporter permease [Nitrososphaerota archaeon]|nr:ABC transporter permease [Nitrososphaerota archaeon]
MSVRRVFALAKKDWKRTLREPAIIFMIILFPVILTIAFGTSFGAVGQSEPTTLSVGIVNLGSNDTSSLSHQFAQDLSKTSVLKIHFYSDNKSAQSALTQGAIQGVVIIPPTFDASVNSYKENPADSSKWINCTLSIYLDKASLLTVQVLPSVVQQVFTSEILGIKPVSTSSPVFISTPSLVQVNSLTVFDTFAPGLFAFASIFLIMMVAQSFTTDRETGMLRRIITTPTKVSEIMTSEVLAYLLIGLLQVVLVFLSAYALGYRPVADVLGIAMGFLIAVIFSICNVGFGLITAAVSRNSGAATGISFLFLLPQMFLGTFVGSALSSTAQAAGRFVPAYYVTDALTSLFTRGASITSTVVLTDLAAVSVSSVVILAIGIFLFKKFGGY